MGRPKPTKIKGNFILRADQKPDANGRNCIYIDYILQSKHAKMSSDVWIERKFWDEKKRQILPSHPLAVKLNRQLENFRREIDDRIFDYSQRGRLTIDVLRALVQGRSLHSSVKTNDDFVDYAKRVMTDECKLGRIGVSVRDNALCSLNRFRKFLHSYQGEDSLYIKELTVDLVKEYIFWRQQEGNTNATINKALTPLIKAARKASSERLIDSMIYEELSRMYLPIRIEQGEEDEKAVRFLTTDQLKEFVALYDKVKYPRTRDYMDMFMFSFYACGLRVSDLVTLEWKSIDFEKRELRKVLFKGNKLHSIPLNDGAMRLLRKWQGKSHGRFVFGLLEDDFDLGDADERKRVRLNKNRAILTSLKEIGEKLNLPFPLTMHVARHTFAVTALNKGVDVHKISRLMGHSSISVTEKVYAEFMPSTLEDEVMTNLNFDF